MSDPVDKLRVDKWLWAARFFKTRTLAAAAIENGRVMVAGVRVKPAKTIVVGDFLELHLGPERWDGEILALSDKRGPAPVAQRLYRESEASKARRAVLAERLKLQPIITTRGRPTKRDRREIEKLKSYE